jgi:hypothetical protein
MRRKLAIATRNGRPAWENPREPIRGDTSAWMARNRRARSPEEAQPLPRTGLARVFRRKS